MALTDHPAEALPVVLAGVRACLGAAGPAILRAEGGELVPVANDELPTAFGHWMSERWPR